MMPTPMWSNNTVYLIVTVGVKGLKYRVTSRKPASLKQNEFAYKFVIQIDLNAWNSRIREVILTPPKPPEIPKDFPMAILIAKPVSGLVMDRLQGKQSALVEEDLSFIWNKAKP